MLKIPLRVAVSLQLFVLLGCTSVPRGLAPVEGFDATRYLGRWYEIVRLDHRFERGLTDVSAEYSAHPDGGLTVVNRGYDPDEQRWREVRGRACFRQSPDVGSLKVSFFWPIYGGYHVIELDRKHYQYAMVAGPSRSYLWILARQPRMPPERLDQLVKRARELGFGTDRLIYVEHRFDCLARGSC